MDSKFIIVNDKNTIAAMIRLGFDLMYNANDTAIFVNNTAKKIDFAEIDKKNLVYTNKIFI